MKKWQLEALKERWREEIDEYFTRVNVRKEDVRRFADGTEYFYTDSTRPFDKDKIRVFVPEHLSKFKDYRRHYEKYVT